MVVHIDYERAGQSENGFEIVRKDTNTTVFLYGGIASLLQAQINAWQADAPQAEEVEAVLDDFTAYGVFPLLIH